VIRACSTSINTTTAGLVNYNIIPSVKGVCTARLFSPFVAFDPANGARDKLRSGSGYGRAILAHLGGQGTSAFLRASRVSRSELFGGIPAPYQMNGSKRYLTFRQYSWYPARSRRNSCSSLPILLARTAGKSIAGMSAQ
jgi:hypothetical protein